MESSSRDERVRQWAEAQATFVRYDAGVLFDGSRYDAGTRLLVENNGIVEQVMDTCERPWCRGTVDAIFDKFPRRRRAGDDGVTRVLERGFGLGIMADYLFQKFLGLRDVDYHVIELNRTVAAEARAWKESRDEIVRKLEGGFGMGRLGIKLTVHEGDSLAVTRNFLDAGDRFDVICSDTYPLKGEEGANDLLDLEISKQLLTENGIFTFFAYAPHAEGSGLSKAQRDTINEHFAEYAVSESDLCTPPPEYTYMWPRGEAVRRLTIVKCRKPRLSS